MRIFLLTNCLWVASAHAAFFECQLLVGAYGTPTSERRYILARDLSPNECGRLCTNKINFLAIENPDLYMKSCANLFVPDPPQNSDPNMNDFSEKTLLDSDDISDSHRKEKIELKYYVRNMPSDVSCVAFAAFPCGNSCDFNKSQNIALAAGSGQVTLTLRGRDAENFERNAAHIGIECHTQSSVTATAIDLYVEIWQESRLEKVWDLAPTLGFELVAGRTWMNDVIIEKFRKDE